MQVQADGRLSYCDGAGVYREYAETGTRALTWTIDNDAAGSEPANGAGLKIEGGSGGVSATWNATANTFDIVLPQPTGSPAGMTINRSLDVGEKLAVGNESAATIDHTIDDSLVRLEGVTNRYDRFNIGLSLTRILDEQTGTTSDGFANTCDLSGTASCASFVGIDSWMIWAPSVTGHTLDSLIGIVPRLGIDPAGTLSGTVTEAASVVVPKPSIGENVTVPTFSGLKIDPFLSADLGSGASVTTNRGLWIGDQTAGSTDHSIYTGVGSVHFGGNTDITGTLETTGGAIFGDSSFIKGATPQLFFRDANMANQAQISAWVHTDCTDNGAGTEDCDIAIYQAEAGVYTRQVLAADADGGITIGASLSGLTGNDSFTVLTDGTGDGEVVLPADSIGDAEVADGITAGTCSVALTGDSATSFFSTGTIEDARLPAAITRDTEWDTAAEINAATTDADLVLQTTQVIPGTGISGGGALSGNVTVNTASTEAGFMTSLGGAAHSCAGAGAAAVHSNQTVSFCDSGGNLVMVGGYIDVRQAGVTCDGVTDDTAAMQTALDSGENRTVVLPYDCAVLITATLDMLPNTRLIMLGNARLVASGKVCSNAGDYNGAACSTAADCDPGSRNTGEACSGTQFAASDNTMLRAKVLAANEATYRPSRGHEIYGGTFDGNQWDEFPTCNAGNTQAGKPCRKFCSANSHVDRRNLGCVTDSFCQNGGGVGTCTNAGDCSGGDGACTSASNNPAGSGKIKAIDFSTATDTRIVGVKFEHFKAADPVVAVTSSLVSDSTLTNPNTRHYMASDTLALAQLGIGRIPALTKAIDIGSSTRLTNGSWWADDTAIYAGGGNTILGVSVGTGGSSLSKYGISLGSQNVVSESTFNLAVKNGASPSTAIAIRQDQNRIINNIFSGGFVGVRGIAGVNGYNVTIAGNRLIVVQGTPTGPFVISTGAGWIVQGNYANHNTGSTPGWCSQSNATNYLSQCSCTTKQCSGGSDANKNCAVNGDCASNVCATVPALTYPCAATGLNGGGTCDSTASKATCESSAVVVLGEDGKYAGFDTFTRTSSTHNMVQNNVLARAGGSGVELADRTCTGSPATLGGCHQAAGSNLRGLGCRCTADNDCISGQTCSTALAHTDTQVQGNYGFVGSDGIVGVDMLLPGGSTMGGVNIANNEFNNYATCFRFPSDSSKITADTVVFDGNVCSGTTFAQNWSHKWGYKGQAQRSPIGEDSIASFIHLTNKSTTPVQGEAMLVGTTANNSTQRSSVNIEGTIGPNIDAVGVDAATKIAGPGSVTTCSLPSSTSLTRGDRLKVSTGTNGKYALAALTDNAYAIALETVSGASSVRCLTGTFPAQPDIVVLTTISGYSGAVGDLVSIDTATDNRVKQTPAGADTAFGVALESVGSASPIRIQVTGVVPACKVKGTIAPGDILGTSDTAGTLTKATSSQIGVAIALETSSTTTSKLCLLKPTPLTATSVIYNSATMGCQTLSTTTKYIGLSGVTTTTCAGSDGDAHRMQFPSASTLKFMQCTISAAPGSAKSRTFNAYKNGTTSVASCQVSGTTALSCDTGALSISLAANDKIGIKADNTGSGTASADGGCVITWTVP